MEQTECSETSAYKIQTPGNYPEENIQHTEHGESLKSRIVQSSSLHCCFHTVVGAVIRNANSAKESDNLLSGPLYNGLNRLLKELGNDPY
jgi:hypothetical protein